MDHGHFVRKLEAESPYIGQTCPIRRVSLQPGDDVVICQQHDTPITLTGWRDVESAWNGKCHYCGGPMMLTESTPRTTPPPKSPLPAYPEPSRLPNRRIGTIITASLIAVLLLGGGIVAGLFISGALSQSETLVTITPPQDEDTTIVNDPGNDHSGEVLSKESETSTETPTPSAPATPSASPSFSTPTPAYLFRDDFDNDNNQWQLATTDSVEQTIKDDKLILQLDPNPEAVAWTSINNTFQNFVLEVDAQYKQGSTDHVYGLIARQEDDDSFYQFALRQNMFNIYKYDNGQWAKIQEQTPSAAIKPPGETNHLKLIAVENRFQFFANDKLLADIQDETFRQGSVGLLAAVFEPGEAEIVFDNVLVNRADEKTFADETPEPVVRPAVSRNYQLAYTKYEGSAHNLYIADTNGANQQLIFTRAAGPSFSPDKKRLFFLGQQGVNQQIRDNRVVCEFNTISDGIVAIDVPSPLMDICQVQYDAWFCERKGVDLQTEPSDVCTANGISVYQNLDWKEGTARWASASPDNYAVAFDAKPGGGYRIYFRSMLGANQAFRFELIGEQGAWSPDGQRMVYRSGRDNRTGLWISNRDDTGHTNLTISGTDSFPAWSPDGRTIAFSRELDGNWDIYTISIDGSNLQRLTDTAGHDILPVYTPSGEIIFRSTRTGSWGIWKMSGNGANPVEIIPNAEVGPDWAYSRMDVK